MSRMPLVLFLFMLYAVPAAVFCLPLIRYSRRARWTWWEFTLPALPFGLWLSLMVAGDAPKDEGNLVFEPLLCGLAAAAPILAKAVATWCKRRTGPAYFVGWLISCVLVLIIFFFIPAIPQ